MRIRDDFTVGAPAADVWGLIEDGSALECIPGLAVTDAETGTLELNLGADRLVFDGEAAVHLESAVRTVRIEARAVECGGWGRLRLLLTLVVEDHGLFSGLQAEADLALGGDLVGLGRAGRLTEAAHQIADDFAGRLEARLGAPPAPSEAASRAPIPVAAPKAPAGGWLARLRRLLQRDRRP